MAIETPRFTAIKKALASNIYNADETQTIEAVLTTLARHPEVQRLAPEAILWHDNLLTAKADGDIEEQEYALLELYRTLHTAGAGYTCEEQERLDGQKGLHGLSGGLLPLFMTRELITPETYLVDLGAGNGLQGLLLHALAPHRHTLQVELSRSHLAAGRLFQRVLEIPDHRITWHHGDLFEVDLCQATLIYLYRPVRPSKTTHPLYQKLAATLESLPHPVHLVSVADCLTPHMEHTMPPLYTDGFLTITTVN